MVSWTMVHVSEDPYPITGRMRYGPGPAWTDKPHQRYRSSRVRLDRLYNGPSVSARTDGHRPIGTSKNSFRDYSTMAIITLEIINHL